MKKRMMAILVASSIMVIPLLQAAETVTKTFQDKPALTRGESEKLRKTKFLLYLGLLGVGTGVLGMSKPVSRLMYPRGRGPYEKGMLTMPEIMEWIFKSTIATAPIFVSGGYVFAKYLPAIGFSSWYSVSYSIAKVCLYYNINANQYRKILTAAELRKPEGLLNAINELYPKRFGAEWKAHMKKLFDTYRTQANQLISKNSFSPVLTDDERDFVRMVELGAGMANLYYGTKPSPKNTVDSAMKLYKELGLLS